MSSLLRRQLRKYLPEDFKDHPDLQVFMDAVGKSYENYDEKLSMMQRATAISSEELFLANRELEKEAKRQKNVLLSLERAVESLNVNLETTDPKDKQKTLPVDIEKLAKHVGHLATEITRVTEEKNTLLKDLAAQNDSLNNYVKMVSHDLKSPIRNVHALMSWITEEEKENFSEDSKNNCALVAENLTRMDNLINGILQHATVGDHMENRTNVDIKNLLSEIVATSQVPENINFELANDLPVISIQKYWIEQLFRNLVSNAIAATEDKKPGLISIDFIPDEIYWKFTIRDNGKGIPEKYMTTIFEMFTKLESSSNAAGVGLSLVKKITALFQGDVWLESEPNKGTTFYVTFKKDYHEQA